MCDAYPDQHIIYVLNEVPPKCSSDSIIHYFSLPQLVQYSSMGRRSQGQSIQAFNLFDMHILVFPSGKAFSSR